MPCDYERTWFCLPISSLAQYNHHLVFSGQGPFIRIQNASTREIVAQEQAFDFQSIHGIKIQDTANDEGNPTSVLLLLWGGRSIAFARFSFSDTELPKREYSKATLQVGPETEAIDWILDASFAVSKHALPNIAYAVTAHNDVLCLRLEHAHALSVQISPVAKGLNSILYSAHIKPISPTTLLVAAGTVFGEVVLWLCSRDIRDGTAVGETWCSHIHNVFSGHNGSIFGVALSDSVEWVGSERQRRFLASCSDDRTIRLWDISDCDDILASGPDANTDVSQGRLAELDKASFAVTWAHSSRIWGVQFMGCGDGSSGNQLRLISRGEDATCQVWEPNLEKKVPSAAHATFLPPDMLLSQAHIDHYHSGKHIWSLAEHSKKSSSTIYSGGSDGAIIARTITAQKAPVSYISVQVPFRKLLETVNGGFEDGEKMANHYNDYIKQYRFVSRDDLLATTNDGRLITGHITAQGQKMNRVMSINWSLLLQATELRGFAIMAGEAAAGVIYIGSASGNIWVCWGRPLSIQILTSLDQRISNLFTGPTTTNEDGTSGQNLLVTLTNSLTAKLLRVVQSCAETDHFQVLKSVDLSLPPNFQPTAMLEIPHRNHFVLGSRSGAFAIYLDYSSWSGFNEACVTLACIRHIHGSDTVTGLQHLRTQNDVEKAVLQYDVLSTGRDGSYAIHRITFQDGDAGSQPLTLITLHRACPPFGPNIEGAHLSMRESSGMDLILYGFDGKDFVVWNASKNSEVIGIPCGGAHRSWAYHSNGASQLDGESDQGGCFVWTKAGQSNMVKFDAPVHQSIQTGGHGREVRAMALQSGIFRYGVSGRSNCCLVATGAEDTTIRLWAVMNSSEGSAARTLPRVHEDSASCIRILKRHTTGIQQLAFCEDFLFSSSGCEDLFIWKINPDVSGVGIGTVFQAALPKSAAVSDLRITDFDVSIDNQGLESDSALPNRRFLIYAAYSNSMVRLFKYSNNDLLSPEDRFQLLAEGYYNTTCLTHLHRLPASPYFLTTSTNGAVAVWPHPSQSVDADNPPAQLSYVAEHSIHQNAILALQSIKLAPAHHLLLTGGDDNAFGISLFAQRGLLTCQRFEANPAQSSASFTTLLIPRAHAAAITALAMLDSNHDDNTHFLTVATAGNDQRLKIWRISVDLDQLAAVSRKAASLGPDSVRAIDVQLLREMWTSVADVSSMMIVPGAGEAGKRDNKAVAGARSKRLMLAGIGMEIFSVVDLQGKTGVDAVGEVRPASEIRELESGCGLG